MQYTSRKPRAKKPTAHISYDQGLNLIRSFLVYASHHTVEEVQAFTGQWVPVPTWVRTENVLITADSIDRAANLLTAQLGEEGIEAIGGKTWWQWRRNNAELKAEWVEMRSDYNVRQRKKERSRRVMLYIHGGAYFFGSVDEHRYQMQRHARKLNARVFAPRYRLAPQFPFPCGILDCLAAYMYLLTLHDPSEIIFAGDSAGGGMVLSLLCLLRDQGVDMPAGAILISPWVDLTHSFPSLSRTDGYDYIPEHGFMQKPSLSWPPPNADELVELTRAARDAREAGNNANGNTPKPVERADTTELASQATQRQPPLSLQIDGKEFFIKEQIQLYTTNQLITHPLVSPALQPSLGGLPPLLVMVGGGELLRDEQIYIAHKAADPYKYKLPERWRKLYDPDDTILNKYSPTPVQLQVWEDLCHVAPTLSFTRPAKFMYRSISQFGAWALSRAQQRAVEITEDDHSSIISSSSEDESLADKKTSQKLVDGPHSQIGKAGDPLPAFKNSMIREQVDRHGVVYPLPHAAELPALQMAADLVGVVKEGPIRQWLAAKAVWDNKYASTRRRIRKQRMDVSKSGKIYGIGEGEHPPPSALAGRQQDERSYSRTQKLKKSWGLGMWSSWSWKHDERTLQRDEKLDKQELKEQKEQDQQTPNEPQTDGALASSGKRVRSQSTPRSASRATRYRRKTKTVENEGQIEGETGTMPTIPRAAAQDGTEDASESAVLAPALAVDPPTPEAVAESTGAEQNLSSMFIPKWKNAAHLRDDARDISDAGSTYSHASKVVPDNASTMAVFSAPGVQRQDSTIDTSAVDMGTSNADGRSFDFRPSKPGPKDNLGGYDTPVSRRSVERLQRHQTDMTDGQSIHSSIPASVLTLDGASSSRIQPLRSSSATAVVQAEGVIAPIEEDLTPASETSSILTKSGTFAPTADDRGHADMDGEAARQHIPMHATPKAKEAQATPSNVEDEPTTPTATRRPVLYDRSDTDFVTAHEEL